MKKNIISTLISILVILYALLQLSASYVLCTLWYWELAAALRSLANICIWVAAVLFVVWLVKRRKTGKEEKKTAAVRRPTPVSPRREEGHDHIQSMALDEQGRLRQLDVLRDAGLLTPEEYRAKKAEILNGR